jgi:hypothetical protein
VDDWRGESKIRNVPRAKVGGRPPKTRRARQCKTENCAALLPKIDKEGFVPVYCPKCLKEMGRQK